MLPLNKVDKRYFFELDMLFRLNIAGAVVFDVPTRAIYEGEKSNLQIYRIVGPFFFKNLRNFLKRIVYRYFLRDVNIGSLELVLGLILIAFGVIFGVTEWVRTAASGHAATAGTVMLAGLPILVGVQMVLGFLAFDVATIPKVPLQCILGEPADDISTR